MDKTGLYSVLKTTNVLSYFDMTLEVIQTTA